MGLYYLFLHLISIIIPPGFGCVYKYLPNGSHQTKWEVHGRYLLHQSRSGLGRVRENTLIVAGEVGLCLLTGPKAD